MNTIKLSITSIDNQKNEQRRYIKYLRFGESFMISFRYISEQPGTTPIDDDACLIKNENGEIFLLKHTSQDILINGERIERSIKINDGDQVLFSNSINLSLGVHDVTGKEILKTNRPAKEPIIIEIKRKAEEEDKAQPTTDLTNPIGHEISGYLFQDVLQYGNMGVVYKGLQRSLNREVAIKTISPKNLNNPTLIKRFMNMAKLAWRLNHPYIVQIYDTGYSAEFHIHFVVMELIQGDTLRALLSREGRLKVEYACKIMSQLASALSFAHRQSIIHRDVNPSNIIITKNDYIKLVGMALSKVVDPNEERLNLTAKGQTMGTVGYISPEQAKSAADVDFRTDIYSYGVIFYECLTGKMPYDPEVLKDPNKYAKALKQPPKDSPTKINPMVPEALSQIVMKCLDPNPDKRYQRAEEIVDDIKIYTDSLHFSSAQKRIRAMFPKNLVYPGLDCATIFEPMEEIGGDFYDYINLDQGKIGVVIGDVTGHGVEAAVVMGMIKSVLKLMAKNFDRPAEVLECANREISPDMDSTTFATVAYLVLDFPNRIMTFARAGHNPLIVYNPNRSPSLINFAPKGTVLGVPWPLNVEEVQVPIQAGDVLVEYTDGITEAKNAKTGEEFGQDRLCELIERISNGTAQEIALTIKQTIQTFSKDSKEKDDVTILVMKVKE